MLQTLHNHQGKDNSRVIQ